ncbi:MAG: hypothetical protein HUJ71_07210 [Pseudobutyrivibrio sp.]|nr:hypothetical protein [Pseudobutyrivibrio sp.]
MIFCFWWNLYWTEDEDSVYEVFEFNVISIKRLYCSYESSHPIKAGFDKAGKIVYTTKEIDAMIAEKETKEGLTEEIKNGEIVEWLLLE